MLSYKFEIFKDSANADKVSNEIESVQNETDNLLKKMSSEQLNGPLRSKDFLPLLDGVNKSIGMLRKQVQMMEKQRLQDNFNRVPKDIAFMTKTEEELKREMCLAIDDA